MNHKTLTLQKALKTLLISFLLLGYLLPAYAQTGTIKVTGKVIDETKVPMIGVSVVVKGTTLGISSDLEGSFSLQVPNGTKELTFSYVGYQTLTVTIPANHTLLVQMKPNTQQLNDVVVIGYGTTRKSDLTGSVSSVKSKDFNGGMISSPEQLINGKVSGVQIMYRRFRPDAEH